MDPLAVVRVLELFDSAGIEVVIDGGWGIDALVGEQTREHKDLDLVIERSRLKHAKGLLGRVGLTHDGGAWPGLPARVLMRGQSEAVDLHPVVFDEVGNGWQQLTERSWGLYDADGLSGLGRIGSRPVACLTAGLQLRHHLGYEWSDDDLHDLELLHLRFGVPLPPGANGTG